VQLLTADGGTFSSCVQTGTCPAGQHSSALTIIYLWEKCIISMLILVTEGSASKLTHFKRKVSFITYSS